MNNSFFCVTLKEKERKKEEMANFVSGGKGLDGHKGGGALLILQKLCLSQTFLWPGFPM